MASSKDREGPFSFSSSPSTDRNSLAYPTESSVDSRIEKRLVRTCDLRITAVLGVMWMFFFLDRNNIGNARIQGMERDLNMHGSDFNLALLVVVVPYTVFGVLSNFVMRKFRPSKFISTLVFFWGVLNICSGVTTSYGGLLACRFLLGVLEAGFSPGALYLMSMYYKRYELQKRFTFYYCCSAIAGAFGGLFAYACAQMAGIGAYAGWRWIFIVEGLMTIVVAIAGYFILADYPENTKFLSENERQLLLQRQAEDTAGAGMNKLDKKTLKLILSDWKIYGAILMFFPAIHTGSALMYFMPTILHSLGWTATSAQIHSIPIWLCAVCVSLLTAFLSDRLRHRFAFILSGFLFTCAGLSILVASSAGPRPLPPKVQYAALFIVTAACYTTITLVPGWASNNWAGHWKRAIGLGMKVGFGTCGNFVAIGVFRSQDAPGFLLGYSVTLGLNGLGALVTVAFLLGLVRENGMRRAGLREGRLVWEGMDVGNLGDAHPGFRFVY